jgi:hypothetical protein
VTGTAASKYYDRGKMVREETKRDADRLGQDEYYASPRPSRMVVDCALVSAKDEILFVGRIVGTGSSSDVEALAKAVGQAIAEELSGG